MTPRGGGTAVRGRPVPVLRCAARGRPGGVGMRSNAVGDGHRGHPLDAAPTGAKIASGDRWWTTVSARRRSEVARGVPGSSEVRRTGVSYGCQDLFGANSWQLGSLRHRTRSASMQRLRRVASGWYRCCTSLLHIGPSLQKPRPHWCPITPRSGAQWVKCRSSIRCRARRTNTSRLSIRCYWPTRGSWAPSQHCWLSFRGSAMLVTSAASTTRRAKQRPCSGPASRLCTTLSVRKRRGEASHSPSASCGYSSAQLDDAVKRLFASAGRAEWNGFIITSISGPERHPGRAARHRRVRHTEQGSPGPATAGGRTLAPEVAALEIGPAPVPL